ncbi:MAG: class I SAM-dependent methyltransferase [Phycisphaeraceae bacterium]|nr:class I SAM-dependent methyltransferase [Phycisphaeraceae bacterium]
MLANRLARRLRHLRGWAEAEGVSCFRLYERDIPEFPLIVDWYDGDAVAWIMPRTRDDTPEAERAFRERAIGEIRAGLALGPERLWIKERAGQRAGGSRDDQYERLQARGAVKVVTEHALRFEVNLSDYLDTGLFLDHRTTRSLIRRYAEGKRFLNLFAYTGSFTVHARAGGARASTTVDMSRTYQDWTRRNFALNGQRESPEHRLVTADCLAWLRAGPKAGESYDLIVCDPPTFSNSKRMGGATWAIDRDYPELLRLIEPFLATGGFLYFSTNSRGLKWENAAVPAGLQCRDLGDRTVPQDFRNRKIHRCWRLSKPAADRAGE